jgi:hypothetical protein
MCKLRAISRVQCDNPPVFIAFILESRLPMSLLMSHPRRLLRLTSALVLVGTIVTVIVAWLCSACLDVGLAGKHRSAEAMTGELVWTVERWDRPGATYVVSRSLRDWSWSPSQATGAPNTPAYGDQTTAWASLNSAGPREWLCLEYATAVMPKLVRIYETLHPGAVDRVSVFAADGSEVDAWRGVDPAPQSSTTIGISEIPLHVNFPIRKLTIHLNSAAVPGWNEIDAAGLVSTSGDVQWARRAIASSGYGAPPVSAADLSAAKALLPAWGVHERFGETMTDEKVSAEAHAIDGRGWPLVALWCERDASTGVAIAGALGSSRKRASAPAPAVPPPVALPAMTGLGPASSSSSFASPPAAISAAPSGSPALLQTALPYCIAWQGFLADVAFYSVVLAALRWLLIRPWRLTIEVSRMRHGRCIACGYDLGYDFRAGCPECGWRRKGREPVSQPPLPGPGGGN